MRVIDFRSDTVTHPTAEMRRAMFEAEVGDDVYGEDPTVNRLEALAADTFGKEAAVIVSSGTMGNLVAMLAHCQRGDEIIMGDKSHTFNSEAGGASTLGGIAFHPLPNDIRGMLDLDQLEEAIRPDNEHYAPTRLIVMENTHNACGGAVLTSEDLGDVAEIGKAHDIALHIDGARIFNAAVYLETPVSELVKDADTVQFCLSKGLSAPVGSIVCGSHNVIERARRWRKVVGGSMRQAGVFAAAGVVAIETMVDRLAEDHGTARQLAMGLSKIPGIDLDPSAVATNMVFFEIKVGSAEKIALRLNENGIKVRPRLPKWRFVTHQGITSNDIEYALEIIEGVFKEYSV